MKFARLSSYASPTHLKVLLPYSDMGAFLPRTILSTWNCVT